MRRSRIIFYIENKGYMNQYWHYMARGLWFNKHINMIQRIPII